MATLFDPFTLKDVTLRNRIAVPPMCQYSATDGFANDWYVAHYSALARGGAGLVIVEATAVSPEGRITPGCLGLWNDEQIEALARVAAAIKAEGAVPGIQINHAGRKASANRPWEGDDHIPDTDPRGWQTLAPSAIPFGAMLNKTPKEMSLDDINRVSQNFAEAACRARQAGFEWLELHFAHGYLAQNFFSTQGNQRQDGYGGSHAGRARFLLETLAGVRNAWPENFPLTIRFGVVEYDGRDEETFEDSMVLVRELKEGGMDLLNVSMGFSTPDNKVPWGPAFFAPMAQRVRREANLPVASSWGLDIAVNAQRAIEEEQMDIVMIGRAMLGNPYYPYTLARQLGLENPASVLPHQYAHWLGRYRFDENYDNKKTTL